MKNTFIILLPMAHFVTLICPLQGTVDTGFTALWSLKKRPLDESVDLWENADRQPNNNDNVNKYTDRKRLTNTLKEALKHRPPVAEFIQQITKEPRKTWRKVYKEKEMKYIIMMSLMIILKLKLLKRKLMI